MTLGPHTITRLRGTPILDPYSNEQTGMDWDDPDLLPQPGCSVQPGAATAELIDQANRQGVVIDYTAFAPTFDVAEGDRVEWSGHEYEIPATIQLWDFPPLSHLVIPLKRVKG